MKAEICECPLGVFAFDEDGRELSRKMFPPETVCERMKSILRGDPTPEHLELVRELINMNFNSFCLESAALAQALGRIFNAKFEAVFPNRGGLVLRSKLLELCGLENLWKISRSIAVEKVREESSSKEILVILGSRFLEKLETCLNSLGSILCEWYLPHFPELSKMDLNLEDLIEIISLGSRDNINSERLREMGFSPEKSSAIEEISKRSIGVDLPPSTVETLKKCSELLLSLRRLREHVEEYLDRLMEEVAPNLRAVAGSLLGAKLISKAGGLSQLAKSTSGHLQILGAEKSYFRALVTGGKRPKHGLIYLHPKLRTAPRKLRGKIARVLAGTLLIAARIDATTGRFIGDELNKRLEERLSRIENE